MDFAHHIFSCSGKPKVGGKLMLSGTNSCMLVIDTDLPQAIPSKTSVPESDSDLPTDYHPSLESVLTRAQSYLQEPTWVCQLWLIHVIETGDAQPVKVLCPSHPISSLRNVWHTQLQEMADSGIIQPSNSPWCAPAVYVAKANDEVRICIDFVQLNKVTKKDSLPSAKSRWASAEISQ